MKNILTFILTYFSLLIMLLACDRPVCKNNNPIFDKYAPDSKEYKEELVIQLAKVDRSKLSYWMDIYLERNNLQYILVHIQGDGLCAKIFLQINESTKGIEWLLKNEGMGYRGAGLDELKFEIKQDSVSTEFIFQEVNGIID